MGIPLADYHAMRERLEKATTKNEINHSRNRRSASDEKHEENNSWTEGPSNVNNRPAQAKMDGRGVGTFAVSITILYSSQMPSDLDGGATTLLDCYIDAIGRQSVLDRITVRKLASSLKRA